MATLYRRGNLYWAQLFYRGKRRRFSLETDNYGVARAKLAKLAHGLVTRGLDLPTTTPVAECLQKFAEHLRAHNTPKSAQTDLYRLAEFFGPVCPPWPTTPAPAPGPGPAAAQTP